MNQLAEMLDKAGLSPEHVAEVGVYLPETSNIYDFITRGIRCTLVEPDPKSIALINSQLSQYNIELHPVAICDFNGTVELAQRGASTFVSTLSESPSIVNDSYTVDDKDTFTVKAVKFNEIDDGTIDLLSVDVEGYEWFIIKNLVSRPDVISVETHGAIYINPHLSEITDWMSDNGYVVWYKNKSDTVYIKSGLFKKGMIHALKQYSYDMYLLIRRNRKKLKKKIKSLFSWN